MKIRRGYNINGIACGHSRIAITVGDYGITDARSEEGRLSSPLIIQ